ncbi:hypothetical protein [Dysgonomonas sp. 25]|uniref:hypothetical protein n=1 Tax=Dysgonomonas sp. 25 TaxID=2302933 RepID=UPI0013D3137B|nr:hypothetical protein [Dysgonomonas sp. 25]NDV68161.1 hypothetical protein [Dysgonomonas sp. 25]
MTENGKKLLAEFEIRMKQLMYLCDTLRDENRQLREELSQKNIQLEDLSGQVEQLKAKYDNLKFAKTLSSQDKEAAQETKRRLSKLVRDVDKCITMLKG